MSFQYSKREKSKSYILFYVTITTNKFLNDAEILLNQSFANDEQTRASILEWNLQRKGNTKRCKQMKPTYVNFHMKFSFPLQKTKKQMAGQGSQEIYSSCIFATQKNCYIFSFCYSVQYKRRLLLSEGLTRYFILSTNNSI